MSQSFSTNNNDHPTLLTLPVALVLREDQTEGGIFDVDLASEIISDLRLYRLERRSRWKGERSLPPRLWSV